MYLYGSCILRQLPRQSNEITLSHALRISSLKPTHTFRSEISDKEKKRKGNQNKTKNYSPSEFIFYLYLAIESFADLIWYEVIHH